MTALLFAGYAAANDDATQALAVEASETAVADSQQPTQLGCVRVEKVCAPTPSVSSDATNAVIESYCEEQLVPVPCEQPVAAPVQGECKTIEEMVCEQVVNATAAEGRAGAEAKACSTVQKTVCAAPTETRQEASAQPPVIRECPKICRKTKHEICVGILPPLPTATTATAAEGRAAAGPSMTTAGASTSTTVAAQQAPVLPPCRTIEIEECTPDPSCVAEQGAEDSRLSCKQKCVEASGRKQGFDVQACLAWCASIGQPIAAAAQPTGGAAQPVQAEVTAVDAFGQCVSTAVKECREGEGTATAACKQRVVEECRSEAWNARAQQAGPVDAVSQCVMTTCANLAADDYAKCKRECFSIVSTNASLPAASVCSQIPDDEVRQACETFKNIVDERRKCRQIADKASRRKCFFQKIVVPLVGEDYSEFASEQGDEKQEAVEKAKQEARTALDAVNDGMAQSACADIAFKAAQRLTEFKNRDRLLEQAITKTEARNHDATELRYLLVKYEEVIASAANSLAAGNCREALETLATADELVQAFKNALKKIVEANAAGQTYSAAAQMSLSTEAS